MNAHAVCGCPDRDAPTRCGDDARCVAFTCADAVSCADANAVTVAVAGTYAALSAER
jgi:hypothetical protein